jgi:hypothetical protein
MKLSRSSRALSSSGLALYHHNSLKYIDISPRA